NSVQSITVHVTDSNLDNAKKAAKEAIEQMCDLSDADKTAAKSNVDNATDIAGVNTAKQDAQDLNDAKKTAKEAINKLTNLNKAQKEA
nr:GA module-containing protein [Enterococcus faecalis]